MAKNKVKSTWKIINEEKGKTKSLLYLLTLNFNKYRSQYLEFRTKNYYNVNTQIKYDQECITIASEIKFIGLTIDDTLSWKQHIEHMGLLSKRSLIPPLITL